MASIGIFNTVLSLSKERYDDAGQPNNCPEVHCPLGHVRASQLASNEARSAALYRRSRDSHGRREGALESSTQWVRFTRLIAAETIQDALAGDCDIVGSQRRLQDGPRQAAAAEAARI
jgi:hypothetical protein